MSPRDVFLQRLRAGLACLPQQLIDDMIADFEMHFTEALAAGRSELQAAHRLGDPAWLAREYLAPPLPRWGQPDPAGISGAS